MIKKIQSNGYVNIPSRLRRLLPSNIVDVKLLEIEVEPGVVKKVVTLIPIGDEKKAITVYE